MVVEKLNQWYKFNSIDALIETYSFQISTNPGKINVYFSEFIRATIGAGTNALTATK